MPNQTVAALPGRSGPPWPAEGTVYFYGGWLSNFAPTPGLHLPVGYHAHRENDRLPSLPPSIASRHVRRPHAGSST